MLPDRGVIGTHLAIYGTTGEYMGKAGSLILFKNSLLVAALTVLFFLCASEVSGASNPYQIWVPYVESPQIEFDGHVDTLGEWVDAGRYDISDLRGSMGDTPTDSGSVFLYASHNDSYLRIAVTNLGDSVLSGEDIVTLWADDNNNDTLEIIVEGKYSLMHYPQGDSLFFSPWFSSILETQFQIGISDVDGYVSFEAKIALGAIFYYIDSQTHQAFGAWIGVQDGDAGGHNGIWPPKGIHLFPEHYGDMYLAYPGEPPPPGPPTNVTVRVDRPDTVVIEWDNPMFDAVGNPLDGLDSVFIYKEGIKFRSIPADSVGAHNLCRDKEVLLTKSYSYRLSAVDTEHNESPLTEAQCVVPGYLYYSSDFEDDNGGWFPAEDSTWEWGEPRSVGPNRAYSGEKCSATNLEGYYGKNIRWQLTSPPISIENLALTRVVFCVYHWYEAEPLFDGGNVRISTDGGTSWNLVEPEDEYPIESISGLDGEPGFGGHSGRWVHSIFEISENIGNIVEMRLDFGSDASTEFSGWYVDNIDVVTSTPGVGVQETRNLKEANLNEPMLVVSPNPCRGWATVVFKVSQPERVGLYVYDLAGRRIATLCEGDQKAGAHSLIWDGTNGTGESVSSGVYICRLNIGASFKAVKLLVIK